MIATGAEQAIRPESSRLPPWFLSVQARMMAWSSHVWTNLQENNLARRIFKYSFATTVTVIIVLIPEVVASFGTTSFLASLTTVFAHPGQRMGQMIESLLLTFSGATVGTAWSVLGLWLSSLIVEENRQGAYVIRAVFVLLAVFHHGFLRSSSPRLIVYILFHLTPTIIILMGPSTVVTIQVVTGVAYPIMIGAGVTFLVNVLILPELSCNYLARTAIAAVSETTVVLSEATAWFLGDEEEGRSKETEEPKGTLPPRQPSVYADGFARRVTEPVKPGSYRWYKRFLPGFRNPFHAPKGSPGIAEASAVVPTLAGLTESKAILREQLQQCKSGQSEVNMEISVSPLPPSSLKPITTKLMTALVQNAITLIGACENKFVLLGDDDVEESTDSDDGLESSAGEKGSASIGPRQYSQAKLSSRPSTPVEEQLKRLELVKPLREVEAGDPEVLEAILVRIRQPVSEFMKDLQQAAMVVTTSLAYCYGLKKVHSGMPTPNSISLEEMDIRIDSFVDALARFDHCSTEELERATATNGGEIDVMPRMETFLVSSFLLSLRQAAIHLLQMLQKLRILVEQRQTVRFRSSVHLPHYSGWRQWLSTGGERDAMVLPQPMRKKAHSARQKADAERKKLEEEEQEGATVEQLETVTSRPVADADEEKAAPHLVNIDRSTKRKASESGPQRPSKVNKSQDGSAKQTTGLMGYFRRRGADVYEVMQNSDDSIYAMKLVVAFFLVSWPGFVPSWHAWYAEVRGVWAPLQLILIFEVAIGTSLFVFLIRLVGVVFGCLIGFLAYEIGGGRRVPLVVILIIGIVPSVYIQLGTKYVKTGMVSISSLTAVALVTVNSGGEAYGNFSKRLITFLVGCSAGLLIELILYPARARDRLVESLSTSIKHMTKMQTAIAVGVDNPDALKLLTPKNLSRFNRSREKAQSSLAAAETFLPFCLTEPRLKGSFRHLHPIYKEIIYVLHQIVDRMDNMLQLRRMYGSSVLEDLNTEVHAYRRAVAACIAVSLFAVREALTTRMPLPQFLPSARLAMLRLVHQVRQALAQKAAEHSAGDGSKERSKNGGGTGGGMESYIQSIQDQAGDSSDDLDQRTAKVVASHKFLSWNANAAGLMEIIEYLEELVELAKLLVGVNAFRSGMLERPTYREYARRIKRKQKPAKRWGGSWDGDGDDHDHDGGGGGQLDSIHSRTYDQTVETAGKATFGLGRKASGRQESAGYSSIVSEEKQKSASVGDEDVAKTTSTESKPRSSGVGGRGDHHPHHHHHHRAGHEEQDIPISLRRVSTRRSSRTASVRRRKNAGRAKDDEGGKEKGKEIVEEEGDG